MMKARKLIVLLLTLVACSCGGNIETVSTEEAASEPSIVDAVSDSTTEKVTVAPSATDPGFVGKTGMTEEDSTGDSFYYETTSDTTAKITGIKRSAFNPTGKITLPSVTPDGEIINEIGTKAFSHSALFEEVSIGGNIEKIDVYAFYECSTIAKVTFTSNVKEIGNHAFDGCERLQSVTFSEGLETIQDHAFYGCKILENVTLPLSLTLMGTCAFGQCDAMTSFIVPESVKAGSFLYDNDSLTYFYMPKSWTYIDADFFAMCPLLTSIDYGGTVDDFLKVSYSFNTDLIGTTYMEKVHCTDGSVTLKILSYGQYSGCTVDEEYN